MNNYALFIQYDGSRYSGWQKQGNTDNTIQGKLEAVLSKALKRNVEIHGAGRTDAGVHAIAQVANFKCSDSEISEFVKHNKNKVTSLSGEEYTDECIFIQKYFNDYLPLDIRITKVIKESERFHARLSAKKKHYRYSLCYGEYQDVFKRKYSAHLPGDYDLKRMKDSSKLFIGKHDFKCFCDNKHMKKSTVRNVTGIDINVESDEIIIDYYGDGFLYHMVRLMTGTLLQVGKGELSEKDVAAMLADKSDIKPGLAPANGLLLVGVEY